MRTMQFLLSGAVASLVLGVSPAVAATTLPAPDVAQKLVAESVNARAVTTLVCESMKMNALSKPVVDYFQVIGFATLSIDGQELRLLRNGKTLISKVQGDWERDRNAVDTQKKSFGKMSSAPGGCLRVPLGEYVVGPVSNIRAGDADGTALVDYTFKITPTSLGDTLVKRNNDPQVEADPVVGVPLRPTFLSFYLDEKRPPVLAQAKLVYDGTAWHIAP